MSIAADSAGAAREQFMLAAIEQARRSMAAGGAPVGACLARGEQLVASAQNAVIAELDVTAHAEIMLLRAVCREQRTLDLSGCQLYVTVEPCLMCFAACGYAGISDIYFGAPISTLQRYTGNEICVPAEHRHFGKGRSGGRCPELHGGLLETDCTALVDQWGGIRGARRG